MKVLHMKRESRGMYSVLPMGKVNLRTGANAIFNVYQTWSIGSTVAQIWRRGDSFVVIFSSGPLGQSIGQISDFKHDRTGHPLFRADLVEEIPLEHLKTKASTYGNSLWGYVYK